MSTSFGNKITAWLRESEWALEDLGLESRTVWGIKATDRESVPLPVAIYELVSRPGMVILQADAQGEKHQFDAVRRNEQLSLDLQSMILKHHVEYNMRITQDKVVIIDRLFEEGLTKNLFWRRLNIVRMATIDTLMFLRARTSRTSMNK